jgi:hypothetical protein
MRVEMDPALTALIVHQVDVKNDVGLNSSQIPPLFKIITLRGRLSERCYLSQNSAMECKNNLVTDKLTEEFF